MHSARQCVLPAPHAPASAPPRADPTHLRRNLPWLRARPGRHVEDGEEFASKFGVQLLGLHVGHHGFARRAAPAFKFFVGHGICPFLIGRCTYQTRRPGPSDTAATGPAGRFLAQSWPACCSALSLAIPPGMPWGARSRTEPDTGASGTTPDARHSKKSFAASERSVRRAALSSRFVIGPKRSCRRPSVVATISRAAATDPSSHQAELPAGPIGATPPERPPSGVALRGASLHPSRRR